MLLSKRKIVSIIIGITIYFVFSLFWGYRHYVDFKVNDLKEKSVAFFLNKMDDIDANSLGVDTKVKVIDYMAVLEIPRINLKQGLMDINSKYNDINYNIAIHELSNMSDVERGNFILMAHSGSSKVSYFKDLDKLSLNDEVYVYYKNRKYVYVVNEIYEEAKTGKININRDNTKTSLTMTTCSNNDNDKQLVVIAYLVSIIEI